MRFQPECVVFDSWYGSLGNLKTINGWGWIWLARLKANRPVNPDRSGLRAVARVETTGTCSAVVHLKGYGLIRPFKIVAPDGDIIRPAVRAYLANPLYTLPATA